MLSFRYTIELDLAGGRVYYREARRQVSIPVDFVGGWRLHSDRIGLWERDQDRSEVSPRERTGIIARITAEAARRHHLLTVVEGETFEPPAPIDDPGLVRDIDRALAAIEPMEAQGWDVAQSIGRQLRWCRATVTGGSAEQAPGPLSMGLIAVREFDMYGSDPDLSGLINSIQNTMNRRLARQGRAKGSS